MLTSFNASEHKLQPKQKQILSKYEKKIEGKMIRKKKKKKTRHEKYRTVAFQNLHC